MRKGGGKRVQTGGYCSKPERNEGKLNESYAGSRCGLEEGLPHWTRVREERTP